MKRNRSTADRATNPAERPSDAIALFNGRDLTGWVVEGTKETKGEAKQPIWSVRDGLMHCEGSGFGFLRYDREFCDFLLHVEYRLTKGCNSGIGIRHAKYTGKSETRPSYSGYEIQLLDDGGRAAHQGIDRLALPLCRAEVAAREETGRMEHDRDRMPRPEDQDHAQRRADSGRRPINDRRDQEQAAVRLSSRCRITARTIDFRNLWVKGDDGRLTVRQTLYSVISAVRGGCKTSTNQSRPSVPLPIASAAIPPSPSDAIPAARSAASGRSVPACGTFG